MRCNGCGNENAYHIYGSAGHEFCDRCGDRKVVVLNDDVSSVHEPYFDEHLCDKAHPNGQWIHSRGQKAEILKQLGLREKRESNIPYISDARERQKYFRNKFGER